MTNVQKHKQNSSQYLGAGINAHIEWNLKMLYAQNITAENIFNLESRSSLKSENLKSLRYIPGPGA